MSPAPFLHLSGAGLRLDAAFALAEELVECASGHRPDAVGRYVVPPADGAPTRPFQTLHVDFGLPLTPVRPLDVATYTALLVPLHSRTEGATTRLVPLGELLGQRSWPARDELVRRLDKYGRTHGAWDDGDGYTEGSLARVVEAADGARASGTAAARRAAPALLRSPRRRCRRAAAAARPAARPVRQPR